MPEDDSETQSEIRQEITPGNHWNEGEDKPRSFQEPSKDRFLVSREEN